jgi:hypothetical protein
MITAFDGHVVFLDRDRTQEEDKTHPSHAALRATRFHPKLESVPNVPSAVVLETVVTIKKTTDRDAGPWWQAASAGRWAASMDTRRYRLRIPPIR